MREDVDEAVTTDMALTDVFVAIEAAGEFTLRVVGVDGDEVGDADLLVELVHCLLEAVRSLDVVAGGERVLRVETHLYSVAAGLTDDSA